MSTADRYRAFVAIPPGLEAGLVAELRDLGLRPQAEPGGASLTVDATELAEVHLYARQAARVTVEVAKVHAKSLEEVARVVRAAPWRRYVWPGQPIAVKAVARGRFPHKGALENKVELAIRDALRGPRLPGPRPPHEPVPVLVHAEGDLVRVSVDASGDLLHRRGWRQETAKAPLRENLAAAVLRLAGWAPGEPLVDPMCGSGTFPIEAATIAMGRAPGAGRTFAFERWPGLDQAAVRKVRAAAGALQVLDRAALIAGSDRDPGAVRAAVGNARRAGVADRVRLDERRFEELVPPPVPGLIVSNTPYGERVGSGQIGWIAQALRARWAGWRVALLVPPSAKRVLTPLGLEEVAGFRNGGIPVRVLVGAIRQDR